MMGGLGRISKKDPCWQNLTDIFQRKVRAKDIYSALEKQKEIVDRDRENRIDDNIRLGFTFPQLSGLGYSAMAQRYAIRNIDQARRYLADPILGNRLRNNVSLMINHKDKSALEIRGPPDDLKFRSCLTLFCEAASDKGDRTLFVEALNQFYNGEPDPRTLELLQSE